MLPIKCLAISLLYGKKFMSIAPSSHAQSIGTDALEPMPMTESTHRYSFNVNNIKKQKYIHPRLLFCFVSLERRKVSLCHYIIACLQLGLSVQIEIRVGVVDRNWRVDRNSLLKAVAVSCMRRCAYSHSIF